MRLSRIGAAQTVYLSPCGRGRIASKDAIRVRGLAPPGKLPFVSADATPHPALRATFSHKGRRIRDRGEIDSTKIDHALAFSGHAARHEAAHARMAVDIVLPHHR